MYAWAIDFERSGYGPRLSDYVELEQDIMTRLTLASDDSLVRFRDLASAAIAPTSLDQPLVTPDRRGSPNELAKSCRVIEEIRRFALELASPPDISEYYWGLLFHALSGASVAGESSRKGRRCLLLAALLCERLGR
jgi:hypothetical protein